MKIPHIYKSNVAGVNLYGIGISVNQEIVQSDSEEIARVPKIFVTGINQQFGFCKRIYG